MKSRIRIHKDRSGAWWACTIGPGGGCWAPSVGPCRTHAEVVEALDAMRPTLEPCS